MKLANWSTGLVLLVAAICPKTEDPPAGNPLTGVWTPNPKVNEVLGLSPKEQWPFGFEIQLSNEKHHYEAIGTKGDLEALVYAVAQHKGSVSQRGTFAFMSSDGTPGKTYDCVLTEKAGCTYLAVPGAYVGPVFAKVAFVPGADRNRDLIFFTWPPEVGGETAVVPHRTVAFSRQVNVGPVPTGRNVDEDLDGRSESALHRTH